MVLPEDSSNPIVEVLKEIAESLDKNTDLLNEYIDKKMVTGELFEGDWLDVGTFDRLTQAEKICTKKSNE